MRLSAPGLIVRDVQRAFRAARQFDHEAEHVDAVGLGLDDGRRKPAITRVVHQAQRAAAFEEQVFHREFVRAAGGRLEWRVPGAVGIVAGVGRYPDTGRRVPRAQIRARIYAPPPERHVVLVAWNRTHRYLIHTTAELVAAFEQRHPFPAAARIARTY